MIAIVPLAIAQQAPFSPAVGRRPAPPSKKSRRYVFAIVATLGVALVSLAFLRHPDSANQVPSKKSNIEAPKSLKATNTAENGGTAVGANTLPATQDFSDIEAFVPSPHEAGAKKDRSLQAADPRPTKYNSLPTGTRIGKGDVCAGGHGELTVENGTPEDAVVRLSDVTTDQTVCWFFVQTQSSAHVSGIPQGSYKVRYSTGLNWVESEDSFSWRPSYSEFDRTFDYGEERDPEGVRYDAIRVTLHSVVSGNVRTRAITREEFLRGHRHVALQQ